MTQVKVVKNCQTTLKGIEELRNYTKWQFDEVISLLWTAFLYINLIFMYGEEIKEMITLKDFAISVISYLYSPL